MKKKKQSKMKDLTVIIPLHEYNKNVEALLTTAVESLKNADKNEECNVIIVSPLKSIKLPDFGLKNLKIVKSEKGDFCTQINTAVDECKTKYFSILEYDDVYTEKWFNNVQNEIETGEQASIYLPLTELVDYSEKDKGSIGYINEVVWANSFSDVIGFLDLDSVQTYINFNVTGGIFITEDFKKIGGLKPSMKFAFWYEFLLRALNSGLVAYVIPKVGYKHIINREGSYTDSLNKTMKPEEADWWVDLSRKEMFFKKDRNKTYEE